MLWGAIARCGSGGRARVRTTVVRRVPPLQCVHLRGILWVFFQGSFGWFWSFLGRVQQELLLAIYLKHICINNY